MTPFVFVGIQGTVVALDRVTGEERWRTDLKGSGAVLFHVDGPALYATAAGEAFCLDLLTGAILWHNKLKGLGLGLASIGTNAITTSQMQALAAAMQEAQRRQAAGAASA